MPVYTINRQSPTQLAQSMGKSAVLKNEGTTNIFLEKDSSVAATAYGIMLRPLDTVSWPPNQDLWAISDADDGRVSVLYGAQGVALGAVGAVIIGDVTASIDGPVDAYIQNGVLDVQGEVAISSGQVNANITNASIPVTGDVNATITNATLEVEGEVNIGGGIVDAHITNASIPVTGDMNVTNSQLDVSVTNASIPVTGDVNATITNATLEVEGEVNIGGGIVDAHITNASIPVTGDMNVTNSSLNVNANVTNASIPVTGNMNANITNATIEVEGEVTVGGILTPVNVVGTGGFVSQISGAFTASQGTRNYTINAPAGGQRGNSWRISGINEMPETVKVQLVTSTELVLASFTAYPRSGFNEACSFDFVVPMSSNYPVTLRISRGTTGTARSGLIIEIAEVSGGATSPDNGLPYQKTFSGILNQDGTGQETAFYIPPSFRPLRACFSIIDTIASPTQITSTYLADYNYSWQLLARDPHTTSGNVVRPNLTTAGNLVFEIPGNGIAHGYWIQYNNTASSIDYRLDISEK
jgi:hypothetical protein